MSLLAIMTQASVEHVGHHLPIQGNFCAPFGSCTSSFVRSNCRNRKVLYQLTVSIEGKKNICFMTQSDHKMTIQNFVIYTFTVSSCLFSSQKQLVQLVSASHSERHLKKKVNLQHIGGRNQV